MMNLAKKLLWVLLLVAMTVTVACGGGDDGEGGAPPAGGGGGGFLPTPPAGGPPAGDPNEQTPFSLGRFTLPGNAPFGDIRGVGVSSHYVYVAETAAIHAFDLNGNYVNTAATPSIAVSMVVIPPDPNPGDGDETHYPFPEYPVVIQEQWGPPGGIASVYAPNLDDDVTVEHADYPDVLKRYDFPRVEDYLRYGIQPTTPAPDSLPPCPMLIARTYDADVTREGTIVVITDTDNPCTPPFPDWPMTMYFFDPQEDYLISPRPTGQVGVEDDEGNVSMQQAPFRWGGLGDQVGSLGQLAISNKYPQSRTDTQRLYLGDNILECDFVGVSAVFVDKTAVPYEYTIGGIVDNVYGYNRILGLPGGALPGSFALGPPIGPDGGLEDPDLDAGGPSGMYVDPRTDDLYVCDPGNRRVQIFNKDLQFKSQIGDGFRGASGNHLIAPSEVAISLDGTIFVADTLGGGIGWLRVFGEPVPPQFGTVGGLVRNMGTQPPSPISEATVSILDANGLVATQMTNINGEYRFESLPLATYFLTADKFGYTTDSASVDLVADQTVIVNFNLYPHLPPTVGYYVGAVYNDVTNQAIPEVTVHLIGTSLSATTDIHGRFNMDDIPAGDYQVEFMHEDYITLTRDLHIVAGQTTRHDTIRLTPLPS